MRNSIQKIILFPSLICISFYAGVQIVGVTEASFSSQFSPSPVTISTAIVFPSSIKELENRAKNIADTINKNYKSIISQSSVVSLQELHEKLAGIKENELEIRLQLEALQNIKKELSTSYQQIKSQKGADVQTYTYVSEGYQNVLNIVKEVQSEVDFQKIEAVRSSVSLQINKLEETTKGNK
ncbi:DUF4047 domain-containing protein [Gottfriedia acidiceleris]|uniref:DUF4047 domain-containing protein n=1 Tax=Gottfriedia acidiceleris TaxID=371036 RepID=UPI00142FC9EF|nr:DUF4047 domain-containing protein [Gottfriedia acidiceleris]